jgi:hypothetical protein
VPGGTRNSYRKTPEIFAVGGRGGAERTRGAVAATDRGGGDRKAAGQQGQQVVQPELGPPLRECHARLGTKQPAQGPLAGAGGAAEISQTAITAGVGGQRRRTPDGSHRGSHRSERILVVPY